jgi:YegS/Rv2252/BmrU family lipid kinase
MNKPLKDKMLFVVNPISGVRHKGVEAMKDLIGKAIDHSRFSTEIILTKYAGHAAEIVSQGFAEGIRFFVVAGGDGTVNEVASKLVGTDAILGIIPAGSGNGLAHHLEIPIKPADALNVISKQKVLDIDTCLVNDVFFVSIAGIGFDARVARQFAKSRRRGFLEYSRIVFKEYFLYRSRKFKLLLDGKEVSTSAFFISFANSGQFGYNTRIAPGASLIDGLIDVCIVRKPPVQALPGIAHLLYSRKIDKSKYIDIYRASEIIIEREKGKTVNVDGEAVKMKKNLIIKLIPASLKIIVP